MILMKTEESKIGWTNYTFNLVWGCVKVSPECDNCYAETTDARWNTQKHWGKDAPRKTMTDSYWNSLQAWQRRAEKENTRYRVFCSSMADVFEDHETVNQERLRLFEQIEKTPRLDYLLLTKRPQNIKKTLGNYWSQTPGNIWLGTTVGCKASMWRVPALLENNAAVRFVSAEPLIEDIDNEIKPYIAQDKINWLIVGGESGNNARPMEENWAHWLKTLCNVPKVAFYMKQMGGIKNKRDQLCDIPLVLRRREFPFYYQPEA